MRRFITRLPGHPPLKQPPCQSPSGRGSRTASGRESASKPRKSKGIGGRRFRHAAGLLDLLQPLGTWVRPGSADNRPVPGLGVASGSIDIPSFRSLPRRRTTSGHSRLRWGRPRHSRRGGVMAWVDLVAALFAGGPTSDASRASGSSSPESSARKCWHRIDCERDTGRYAVRGGREVFPHSHPLSVPPTSTGRGARIAPVPGWGDGYPWTTSRSCNIC